MKLLWTGDSELPEGLVWAVREEAQVARDRAALRTLLASPAQRDDDWVVLVDFDAVRCDPGLLPELHQLAPLVPTGLVVRCEDRDAAFALLRDRMVDRVVPSSDLEGALDPHLDALQEHGARLRQLRNDLAPLDGSTVLMTGATGFLGGHFLRYLLRCSGVRVLALVRDSAGEPGERRLAHFDRLHPGRIVSVSGDLKLPGLGLTASDRARIASEVDAVWHLAADTRFEAILRDELFATNFQGTCNLLEFAQTLPGLKHFYHVSTAYVAGEQQRDSLVQEARLRCPSGFKNPYEESKFAAECAVVDTGLPVTIFRPSIILGERVSGLCDGQTVYKVAQLLRLARLSGRRSHPDAPQTFRVVVDPDTTKNLVVADDVVFHMLQLSAQGGAPGRFYHLTHPSPTMMADLIAVIAEVLNIPEYEAVSTLEGATLSTSESVLQRISGVFRPYMLNSDPEFVRSCPDEWMSTMDQSRLQFLLQSFFEQHYGWHFQPGTLAV